MLDTGLVCRPQGEVLDDDGDALCRDEEVCQGLLREAVVCLQLLGEEGWIFVGDRGRLHGHLGHVVAVGALEGALQRAGVAPHEVGLFVVEEDGSLCRRQLL